MDEIFAAIEGGGTKWICALGNQRGKLLEEISIKTTSPAETLSRVIDNLQKLAKKHGDFKSIGIGSFGPIELDPTAKNYGSFLKTPKEGWSHFNMLNTLRKAFGNSIPIHLDTDVNAAAYAEAILGAGKSIRNLCYVTVGTGIGGGVYMDGKLLKGRMHPEVGHLMVQESNNEPVAGFSVCPFHTSCIEGKASGRAMQARWGNNHENFPEEAWKLEAHYLGQLCISLTACYSPDLIIFGGGVSKQDNLLPMIRSVFKQLANSYWSLPTLDRYIVPTQLNDKAGLLGALLLATKAL